MVVCFRLPMKGAADAAVAHTTARKTERKKVPENFMAECRYGTRRVRGETDARERVVAWPISHLFWWVLYLSGNAPGGRCWGRIERR